MLRYNNSSGIGAVKPVDYYRPLTVDVSVEYELPKEVAPPKGSAPLLIIHPSAYFRSKPNSATSSPTKPSHHQSRATSTTAQSQQRLGDIASTLYYLSTNGLPPPPPNQNSSPQQHITGSSRGANRGLTAADPNTSRITRSRTAKAQNCDDYRSRLMSLTASASSTTTGTAQSMKFSENVGGRGGVIKKVGHSHQNHQSLNQFSQNHLDGSGGGGYLAAGYGPVPMDSSTSVPTTTSAVLFTQGQQPAPQQHSRTTASNKRLRMMNQQQPTMYPPNTTNSSGLMLEPLNLALTPTPQLPTAYNNQPFSTFLGYGGLQSAVPPGRPGNNSPSTTLTGQTNQAYPQQPQHLTSFQQNHFLASAYAQQQQLQQHQHQRHLVTGMSKEGPVPVNKGSGSDSGVCSENDSDVSPPMAAAPFSNTTSASSQMSRRSNLTTSQEFPGAGCYCCCCPSTSTTSSSTRKNSKVTVKGHTNQIQQAAPAPPFQGLSNYGNLFNVIQQQQHQLLGVENCGPIQPHGGSPMDSSAPPLLHHQQQQQRKWLGSVTTTLLTEGLTSFAGGPQLASTFGKRYQV